MKSFVTLMSAPFSFTIFRILSIVFIGVWTYRDAKNKNNNDYIIWTLVSVVVPYYLGVILYILVGRKSSKVICENCHNYTDLDKPYCSYCGEKREVEEDHKFYKKNNIWAILSVISLGLAFIIPIIFFGSNFFFMGNHNMMIPRMNGVEDYREFRNFYEDDKRQSNYESGEVEKTKNKFNYKFRKSNEKMVNNVVYNKNGSDAQSVNLDYKIKNGKVIGKIFIKGNEIKDFEFNDKSGNIKFNLNELAKISAFENEKNLDISFIFYLENATGEINMNSIEVNIY